MVSIRNRGKVYQYLYYENQENELEGTSIWE